MSTPPRDSAASRAEARRRSRLAARGDLPEEEEAASEPPAAAGRGGLLGRLFPPAPELPNRPPALAGFDESGPLRPIRVRAFLLRRNPLAWLGTGLVAAVGFFGSNAFVGQPTIALIGTFEMFGALIAAGWFGWQRPALFGAAAAIFGFLVVVVLAFTLTPEQFGAGEYVTEVAFNGVYQAALGFLGGWYGGYLRRRQTQLSANRARQTRRR
jgi:hypothetical protein